ncbi:zinc-binding alcohol dehydrogenase family protein [Rhodoblastus acidophilus]|uniref:Zinc-binding alcohol dehydrogenase family protein n=1 Tax=Rhodoblastus acidophilus TaxID=1074 RepID=A0A6N8DJK6_RHOAC|nr:zinc-dependent alcohol dehydrogenase family protein [Rhodoblastus acidophilus]MCW2272456.1 propanol-preferring alcohol dehydrogenase [Rhodoblastus acidophilus]MTV29373.1 zinc-binding alcohol dehydrogenase family protein [Rhodoblastus acidophilus]
MFAMVLNKIGGPLEGEQRPDPLPGPGQIRMKVEACGVCRTDLHVHDGELPDPHLPIIPGHEIVGRVDLLGPGVSGLSIGDRVGVPWLGHSCQACGPCLSGHENLCDAPEFTGHTRDGGYASHCVADARFSFPLGEKGESAELAPLLCAGLIGWRAFKIAVRSAGRVQNLGLFGFGAAAHILAQAATKQGHAVFAFTRDGDARAQNFAKSLGAVWAGGASETPPEKLDAAIIFAPVGALVPLALKTVRKAGAVVCAGIHMSDIPRFPYALLWEERQLVSVANLTRRDGVEFLRLAPELGLQTQVTRYPLRDANRALADLRAGAFEGAAVLIP